MKVIIPAVMIIVCVILLVLVGLWLMGGDKTLNPMVTTTDNPNGGVAGMGGGSRADGLYLSHDASVDVEDRDGEQVWGENLEAVIQVDGPELNVYVLDPGTNIFNTRLLEVGLLKGDYISTYFQGDGDTPKGWAAKFRIVMPAQGKYFVYDELRSGMDDRFAWLIEWR